MQLLDFSLSNCRSDFVTTSQTTQRHSQKRRTPVSPSLPDSHPIWQPGVNNARRGLSHFPQAQGQACMNTSRNIMCFLFLFLFNKTKMTQYHYLVNCFFTEQYVMGPPPSQHIWICTVFSAAAERSILWMQPSLFSPSLLVDLLVVPSCLLYQAKSRKCPAALART